MLNQLGYNEEFTSTYNEFVGDFCSNDSENAIEDVWKVCLTILTYLTCLKFVDVGKIVLLFLLILHVLSLSMLNQLGYNEEFSSTYNKFVGDFCSDDSEDAIKVDRKVCYLVFHILLILS